MSVWRQEAHVMIGRGVPRNYDDVFIGKQFDVDDNV